MGDAVVCCGGLEKPACQAGSHQSAVKVPQQKTEGD
jgi:hypothetical protein